MTCKSRKQRLLWRAPDETQLPSWIGERLTDAMTAAIKSRGIQFAVLCSTIES